MDWIQAGAYVDFLFLGAGLGVSFRGRQLGQMRPRYGPVRKQKTPDRFSIWRSFS